MLVRIPKTGSTEDQIRGGIDRVEKPGQYIGGKDLDARQPKLGSGIS